MSVRKVAAVVAVGALAMLSVVTGSSPAWAAVPAPPVIAQSHSPWLTTSNQERSLHGSMDLGVEFVTVSVSSNDVSYTPLCTAVNPNPHSKQVWSCSGGTFTGTLHLGLNYLRATATNSDGTSPRSAAIKITLVDKKHPAPPPSIHPPSITSPADGVYTNDNTPSFAGTAGGQYFQVTTANKSRTLCGGTVAGPTWSCTTNPALPDGSYTYLVTSGELHSAARTIHVDTLAPAPPTITPMVGKVDSSPATTIRGHAEGNATIRLLIDGVPAHCAVGTIKADDAGAWSCRLTAVLSQGTHELTATQTDLAGNRSDLSSPVPITIRDSTPPAPPAIPRATHPVTPPVTPHYGSLPTLAGTWFLNFQVLGGSPAPGQNISFIGGDLPAGAKVTAELHSTPISLGTTVVKSDGTFRLNTVIPNTVVPGAHHYIVTVAPNDDTAQTVELPVTIVAAIPAAIPAPVPVPTIVLPPLSHRGATIVHRDDPAAPNVLSLTLPTAESVLINPLVIAAAAASGLAFLFLVAFPAELLNSTIEENYERLFGRIPKVKLPWLARMRKRLKEKPFIGGLALTVLAALIFSFADPHFGFDLASLRLFLACIIGMFVLGYVANAITGVIIKERWSIGSVIELQPLGLIVALVGVVLSRLLDFAPGLLIGLVLGLSLSASATLRDEARSVLIWAGIVLGLSIACWVAYSLASGAVAPSTFGGALFDDTLVATAVEGISGLVVGLLPIGYFDGASLFHSTRVWWALTYLVALVAFFIIVVPSGQLWGNIAGPFWIWLAVLLAFAALCVGVYLWFRTHPEREEAREVGDGELTDEVAAQVGGRQSSVQ